jgi:hypothetical protein
VKRSLVALLILALSCVSGVYAQQQPGSQAVVPSLIKFGGHLVDSGGKPYSNIAGVTFALYKDQQGGAPLWMETQNVNPDATGHYTVFLGSMTTNGLPLELFSEGEARWLGVQIEGKSEEPRVLLVAVPYALKAADAETLGGKPASAFALATSNAPSGTTSQTGTGSATPSLSGQTSQTAITGQGTANYLPIWKSNTNLGISTLYQTNGNVGINTTSPTAKLEVNGATILEGLLTLAPSGGSALKVTGSAFGVSNTGVVTFASGQSFPGAGTITGVTAGTDLTGGGTTGNVSLNLNLTATDVRYAQLGTANTFSGNQTVVGNVAASGALTGSSANLTGGLTAAASTFSGAMTTAGAVLPSTGTATAGNPFPSNPVDLVASSYNGTAAVNQLFRLQSEGNGSANTGTLNLLYAAGNGAPAETGFSITNQGLINFASGQVFPGAGSGTVTSVGTGPGLTGGPITSSGTISVANGGITNGMLANPSTTINTGTGLTGGGSLPLGNTLTLSVNTSQVPLLGANNVFSGSIAATAFSGDGSALLNVNALTAATATNALNLGGVPASNYAQGTGAQGVLAEWTGTTPPYTVGNSPITDTGGSLNSTESISAPSISTSGSGAGVVTIASGTTSVSWTLGAGPPNSSCSVGSLYSRTDGGAGSTLYVCEGSGQQQGAWVAK